MSKLDIGALVVGALFAYWGWFGGVMMQLIRIGVLVVSALLARAIGEEAALFYQGLSGLHALPSLIPCYYGTLVVLYGGLFVLAHKLTEDLRDSDMDLRGNGDRLLGAVTGGAKGLLIVYLVAVGMTAESAMTM